MVKIDIEKVKARYGIVGNTPQINTAIYTALLVAGTDLSVLISGENGTGKDIFSKIIHDNSLRKHQRLISINCGAIPGGTIDSELFGHEKGSFTGAIDQRKGYFEEANNGTIFLDEVGEMPVGTQARLLRLLEQGEYMRVGSSKVQKSNVRVIAATNVDLREAIIKKEFREDLFYRLGTIPIFLPPLRERPGDVLLLVKKFASEFAKQHNTDPIRLNEEASALMSNYRFPGNIRQLKNIVYQVSVLELEKIISASVLQKYLPDDSRYRFPALRALHENEEDTSFKSEEVILKTIYDMRTEIDSIRSVLVNILGRRSNEAPIRPKENVAIEPSVTPIETPLLPKKSENQITEKSLEEVEREMIIKVLKKHRNKRRKAAEELGISERTLYRKIKQYDID